MRANEKATYVNCPLKPRILAALRAQASANGRPAGREGAEIITRAMERRLARRLARVQAAKEDRE